jgi:hypothetical protein
MSAEDTTSSQGAEGAVAEPLAARARSAAGFLSLVRIASVVVLVVAANHLGHRHHHRADLSRHADHSVSSATKRYLGSAALEARKRPLRLVMAVRRSTPFYARIRSLAEEFVTGSGGKIALEVVDPLRSPDRMQEVVAAYGVSLFQDLLLIDAREDDGPAVKVDAQGLRSFDPRVRVALVEEMEVRGIVEGRRKVTGFRGEDVLLARLVEAVEGKPRRLGFVVDKSRFASPDEPTLRAPLEDWLRYQNMALEEVRIAGLERVPEGLEALVIAAPKFDFTEQEITVLAEYWSRPRSALLVLCDSAGVPPRLRAFLRSNGVTPRGDRVVARGKGGLITVARGVFASGIDFLADLAGQTTEFDGATASIEVREGADDLTARNIRPIGLIEVAPGYWGEAGFGSGAEAPDSVRDHKPPFHLAASVVKGAANDDRFAADVSRMVVVANVSLLDPASRRAENIDFLGSSLNWLVARESLAGVGTRSLATYKLPLLDAQVAFINRLNLFFAPAFLLLAGGLVWSARRA